MVRFLLAHGYGPEQADRQGPSPLCLAVRCNTKLVALTLLDAGAKLNRAEYPSGDTPLKLAADKGLTEIARALSASASQPAGPPQNPIAQGKSIFASAAATLHEHPEWLTQLQYLDLSHAPIDGLRLLGAAGRLALWVRRAAMQREAVELIVSTGGQVR